MALPSSLRSWILRAATSRAIRVEQGLWIAEFFPQLTDISVSTHINGKEVFGSAYGETEDLALTKAVAELLERAVVVEQNLATSSGLAAHTTAEAAAVNAAQELQERDLFLCHFLTRTPFTPTFQYPAAIEPFSKWLQHQKAEICFFELGKTGSVCLIDGRKCTTPFGFILSAAQKESPLQATLSTAISAGRRAHRILTSNRATPSLSLSEFLEIERPSFQHHGQLALNIDYANSIAELFTGAPSHRPELPHATFEVTSLKPQEPRLAECPLTVVCATSPDLQLLFTGALTSTKVNLARLSAFAGRALNFEHLNPLPHPFD